MLKLYAHSIISPNDNPFLVYTFRGDETSSELVDIIIKTKMLWNFLPNWKYSQLSDYFYKKFIFTDDMKFIDEDTGYEIKDFKTSLIFDSNLHTIDIATLIKFLNDKRAFNYYIN